MNTEELEKISWTAPGNVERIREASSALKDDPIETIISVSLLIAAEYYEHKCYDCPDKNKPKP
jgi:hypothetical protein